jgi:hypothetical protein
LSHTTPRAVPSSDTSIATSSDEASVEEFATVSMKVLGAAGANLGTEEQTETFA